MSQFLSGDEDDNVCTKCDTSGHSSASCPDPPQENVPARFLVAFPRAKMVYEDAVARDKMDEKCFQRLDFCLTAVLKSECAPESTPPTAVIPPTPAVGDKPVQEQTNVPTQGKDPKKLTPPTIDLTTTPQHRLPEINRWDASGTSFYI